MSRTLNRLTLFSSFLFVSGVSAGRLGASTSYGQPLRGASQSSKTSSYIQSTFSPSILSHNSGPPAEPTTPFQGQTELKLDDLRQRVLRRNPTLAAMESACRAASSRYPQVTALDDPVFSYGLAPATIGVDRLDLGQRFELSQTFPWPGKLRLRGEAARSEARAVSEDTEAARLQLIEATEQAFYDYYFVHRAMEINDANQELLLELKRITQMRYGAGLVPKQDALQAEVEHQNLIHHGIVLERRRAVTAARLNTLLNVPPQAFLPPPPNILAGVVPLSSRESLYAAALRNRPELHALTARVQARAATIELARREYYPNLTISGGYNSFWKEDELRPFVGVGINVPLQLDRRKAALSEARAREQQAKARLEVQRAEVLFEVSSAIDEVRESAHVVRLYASSIVPAAEDNLAAAQSGYETSTNNFLTLITAEKTLMLARLSYQQALAEYHKGLAHLKGAVGLPLNAVEDLP